jgi:hypothetical protein
VAVLWGLVSSGVAALTPHEVLEPAGSCMSGTSWNRDAVLQTARVTTSDDGHRAPAGDRRRQRQRYEFCCDQITEVVVGRCSPSE